MWKKKKKEAIDEAGLQIFASNLLVSLPMRPYLALTNKHSTWDLIDKIYLPKKKNSLCWNMTDHVILLQTNDLHREQRNSKHKGAVTWACDNSQYFHKCKHKNVPRYVIFSISMISISSQWITRNLICFT